MRKRKAAKPPKPKKPHGRPSTYTKAVADEICARLSKGEPLAHICRDEHMPPVRTVSGWKEAHPDFSADFARARDDGYDALAAQCVEIADDERFDWALGKTGLLPNESIVSRSKLRVETRLKLLAKWDPRRYGEKVSHEVGGVGGQPIQQDVSVTIGFVPAGDAK